MKKNLLLIGGGGHCKSVVEAVFSQGGFIEIGIIDQPQKVGGDVLGIKIIGCDADLPDLKKNDFEYAFISLGSIGNPKRRIELFKMVSKLGFKVPIIAHSSAKISFYSEIEEGVFIGKNVVINADTKLFNNSIINTGSIIEHDCEVGSFSHIAPGVVLSGSVRIGNNTHVGAGTVIRQDICVGDNTIVGIGSVITKNIGDNYIAYGNPCRMIRSNKEAVE